jgi:N-terminal acetyltransferase B complex non-catalytic subunit
MRELLFKLAHRLVTSSPTPSYISSERFYLHLTILKELKLWDEANTLLVSNIGQKLCAASLICDEIRREIWKLRGLSKEEGEKAQVKITESK